MAKRKAPIGDRDFYSQLGLTDPRAQGNGRQQQQERRRHQRWLRRQIPLELRLAELARAHSARDVAVKARQLAELSLPEMVMPQITRKADRENLTRRWIAHSVPRFVIAWAFMVFSPKRKLSKHDDSPRRHTTSRRYLLASYQVHDLVTRLRAALNADDVATLNEAEFLARVNDGIRPGPAARIANDGALHDASHPRVFVKKSSVFVENSKLSDWPTKRRSSLRSKAADAFDVAARVMGYGRHRVRRLDYNFPCLKFAADMLARPEIKHLFVRAARQAFNRSDLGRLRLDRLKKDRRVAQSMRAYLQRHGLSKGSP